MRGGAEPAVVTEFESWSTIPLWPGDRVIKNSFDLQGALVKTAGGGYYQVLDAEFGVTPSGYLSFPALLHV